MPVNREHITKYALLLFAFILCMMTIVHSSTCLIPIDSYCKAQDFNIVILTFTTATILIIWIEVSRLFGL